MSPAKTSRARQLAAIHIAAARMFGDIAPGGDGRAAYEDWLERVAGARSAGLLEDAARAALLDRLRQQKLLPASTFKSKSMGEAGVTASGAARPTRRQWTAIGGLARAMGWDEGLEDARLAGFVKRTAHVDCVRFLTRRQASAVIVGLERWLGNKPGKRKAGRR